MFRTSMGLPENYFLEEDCIVERFRGLSWLEVLNTAQLNNIVLAAIALYIINDSEVQFVCRNYRFLLYCFFQIFRVLVSLIYVSQNSFRRV